jgi:glycosyltransferase involved in cell wall biosynthesis
MALLDAFIITNSEEELIQYALESYASLGDLLGIVSVIDNNSSDATLEIIDSFKDRLNLVVQHEYHHAHHGKMRTMAMEPCTAPWIAYLDSDESWTSNMADWLRTGELEQADLWGFYKYTTILDRFHYVDGGNGPTERLFRNLSGRNFPQSIHTEIQHPGLSRRRLAEKVYFFDATATKSYESLWAKGMRYAWAARENVPAIGGPAEYIVRVQNALNIYPERNKEFPEDIRRLIFTGPDAVPGHPGIPWGKLKLGE